MTQDDDIKSVSGFAGILEDNVEFCKSTKEAKDAYAELTDFTREVIATYGAWEKNVPRSTFGKAVGESAMLTYLAFVLPPLSYGIFFDFLGGNLIASFMQARTLLEQLAKCYLADIEEIEVSDNEFFQNRLQFLERSRRIAKLVGALGSHSVRLWAKLSGDWVHLTRLSKLVDAVTGRGLPSYGIIVPISYGIEDIPDIVELTECVRMLRVLLRDTVDKWTKTSRFPTNKSDLRLAERRAS